MKQVTFGVIVGNRGFFPSHLCKDGRETILKVLEEEGRPPVLRIYLRYHQDRPVIRELVRVSKPGRRVYVGVDEIPRVRRGLGIAILSTSKGVMSDREARALRVGGELMATVW